MTDVDVTESLTDSLRRYAGRAVAEAHRMISTPHLASEAREWTTSAHEALKAVELVADGPMDDDERVALGEHITSLRAKIAVYEEALGTAVTERDGLHRFLQRLAGEFESAETDTASRIAGRIRRTLADVTAPDEDETDRA